MCVRSPKFVAAILYYIVYWSGFLFFQNHVSASVNVHFITKRTLMIARLDFVEALWALYLCRVCSYCTYAYMYKNTNERARRATRLSRKYIRTHGVSNCGDNNNNNVIEDGAIWWIWRHVLPEQYKIESHDGKQTVTEQTGRKSVGWWWCGICALFVVALYSGGCVKFCFV